MAGDVTIERFDKEKDPLVLSNVREDVTMDELLVTVAQECHISPVVRTLFSFKQVTLRSGHVNKSVIRIDDIA